VHGAACDRLHHRRPRLEATADGLHHRPERDGVANVNGAARPPRNERNRLPDRWEPAWHVRLHEARACADGASGQRFDRQHVIGGWCPAVAGGASYAASKHAIIGLTKSAAPDYANQNVCVNAILPGNMETSMMDRFTNGDIQKAMELEPVGRLGRPEEIAHPVIWMSEDLGGFITGAAISEWRLVALST